jgi:hypothetical protein
MRRFRTPRTLMRERAASRHALNRRPLAVSDEAMRPHFTSDARERVEHPLVQPHHPRYYRVMRHVVGGDHHCIGEFATLAQAIEWARTERWRASVWNWSGKQLYNNWHELRP